MTERREIITHSEDGEIPCTSVDFGARIDDLKAQKEINEEKVGVLQRSPSGTDWQLIVKKIPTSIQMAALGVGIVTLVVGGYLTVRHELKKRDEENFRKKSAK